MSNHDHIFTPSKCLSKQQLIQYLQNTLEQEEVYLVESHLNDCALCSDAIDGLMENPEINSNTAIEEIQKAIETKIIAQHPVTQINKLKGIKGAIETSATNKPETLHFFSKYKWQVAASILLFMGLGGYTVFSYIKSHEQSLAKNIHETTVPLSEKQTEYRPMALVA